MNEGEIVARNGSAITPFDKHADIINQGVIDGYEAGVNPFSSGTVNVSNYGIVHSVRYAGIILPGKSTLYNASVIESEQSQAILLIGKNNIITLDSGSQLMACKIASK